MQALRSMLLLCYVALSQPQSVVQQANQLAQMGRSQDAAVLLEQTLAGAAPGADMFEPSSMLAMIYGQSKQFSKAAKAYRRLVKMVCKPPRVDRQACVGVRFNLGFTFQSMRKMDKAPSRRWVGDPPATAGVRAAKASGL